MNAYIITDGSDPMVYAAKSMRDAIEQAEDRYIEEMIENGVIPMDDEGIAEARQDYQDNVIESCTLIAEFHQKPATRPPSGTTARH